MADTHASRGAPARAPARCAPNTCATPSPAATSASCRRPLTPWQRLANQGWLRKAFILFVIAAVLGAYARHLNNPLLVPTLLRHARGLPGRHRQRRHPPEGGELGRAAAEGLCLGLALAMLFTALAMMSRLGNDLLETLTSAFNPLPAIALLPLALIWFGLGDISIIFVLVHSVLWAVALNTHSGFRSVSNTLRMVGRNYGLEGPRFIRQDSDPGRLSVDPHRTEDRLGVRLAHPDRRRVGVRRLLRQGRARLVHLREQEHARHTGRVRRPAHGDPDRA